MHLFCFDWNKFLDPIISISGIRGIPGKSLTRQNISAYVKAFAEFTGKKRIVIGRDGRLGGENIERSVESVLLTGGCEVINLGAAPTPTVALAVETLKASGGIAITASHNPQQWNGLKFINSRGVFLNAPQNKKFLDLVGRKTRNKVSVKNVKQIEYYPSFDDYHISRVLNISSINVRKIQKQEFKIVVDCVNSSGSFIVPKLLNRLGCEVIEIACNGSGRFLRNPEPVPENLRKTMHAVRKHGADLGIVVDPDADRLVLITDEGKPFVEENTIVTAIRNVLRNTSGKKRIAAVNLSTTRGADDVVNELNGKLYRAPVGEINVVNKMQRYNAVIGGEGSGGVILPEVHYCRDSLVGAAIVLNELADFGGRISDYKKTLPQYHILKTKFGLKNIDSRRIFRYVKNKYKRYPINEEDGLRIDFETSWVNFRKSNTEPIMRIIVEAESTREGKLLQRKILSDIKRL